MPAVSGENLVDVSCRELRRLIADGALAPGSRIVETEIAARLGVSRRTAQSALSILLREGLILRPGGQRAPWIVAPLTISGLREVSDLMGALECWIARYAAELDSGPRGRLVRELRAINEELRSVACDGEPDGVLAAELDGRFHGHLVDTVAGRTMKDAHEAQRPAAQLYIRTYMEYQAPIALASAEEHEVVADAIERGDPDAAERALRANWVNACERYAEIIKRVGERGVR
jgi:DNA-binding GntR family transcriptional regulator